jgi:hypothetical protein
MNFPDMSHMRTLKIISNNRFGHYKYRKQYKVRVSLNEDISPKQFTCEHDVVISIKTNVTYLSV